LCQSGDDPGRHKNGGTCVRGEGRWVFQKYDFSKFHE